MPRQKSVTISRMPDKPLAEFSAEEQRAMRSPSVEDSLEEIRQALALMAMFHLASAQIDDLLAQQHLQEDAERAMAALCERAWTLTKELSDGLPGEIANLNVISAALAHDLGIADDHPGFAEGE